MASLWAFMSSCDGLFCRELAAPGLSKFGIAMAAMTSAKAATTTIMVLLFRSIAPALKQPITSPISSRPCSFTQKLGAATAAPHFAQKRAVSSPSGVPQAVQKRVIFLSPFYRMPPVFHFVLIVTSPSVYSHFAMPREAGSSLLSSLRFASEVLNRTRVLCAQSHI
jgi:hypothetical protein